MMRSSTGGSQPRYQAPSGYTTAIGPPSQMRRQFALVRRIPPESESPSSFRRRLRKSQASEAALLLAALGLGLVGAEEDVAARDRHADLRRDRSLAFDLVRVRS